MRVLAESEWRARAAAHRERVAMITGPHRERARRGEAHPVLDFLFTYYSHRPARLERWHPGPGIVLAGAPDAAGYRRVDGGIVLEVSERVRHSAAFVRALLAATTSRRPHLGCSGLHEWAMVYRSAEVRHAAWPLRLGTAGTDAVVEALPMQCTHHDAFRFFTPDARSRNTLQPTRSDQLTLEQPGCLHATMDLYKWAYKLDPATPSELVADCLELAVEVRELDMRASPYDLTALGYEPVRIETPSGRAEYAVAQAGFATRAAPLRRRLIGLCDILLDA